PTIDQTDTANRARVAKKISVRNNLFTKYKNIQRVSVPGNNILSRFSFGQFSHFITAIGLGDKPVQGGYYVRIFLRSVDFQITGVFVDFIFDRIRRYNFNKCCYNVGCLIPDRDSMPWVCLVYVSVHVLNYKLFSLEDYPLRQSGL